MLTPADVDRWDAEAVRAVGRAANERADCATAIATRLAGLPVLAQWDGVAAQAARHANDHIRRTLEAHAEQMRAVARAAMTAAEDIDRIKTEMAGLENGTRGSGLGDVLALATVIDVELACAIGAADQWFSAPLTPAAPMPLTPGTPQEINRWWRGLGDADRAALLAGDPEHLGNLDGIPAADRDSANRRSLDDDLLADTGTARHANAIRVRDALDAQAARTGADTYLLTYQPARFGGQGRAAVAIGNPDTATRTTVVVPGTGNSVQSGWLSTTEASDVFAETAAASGEPTSLVAWMGYDAPDSMLDPRVAVTGLAHRGAELLAADVNALAVTGRAGSRVTVVGHSYGSTTVADAAAGYGMHSTDVVLVGSPGTDLARTAADFHLPPGGHVYVGSASTDPVTTLSGLAVSLGADPAADGFGSTRFKAEVPGFTWQMWSEHSRYFAAGSESLFSIADIAAGNGAALQDHGMTARHRPGLLGALATGLGLPNWSSPLADPELARPATAGHFHTGGRR